MNIMPLTIIGFSAAALTTFSFVPQIIKVIKTRSEKDISLFTLAQLSLGVFLWIIYGVFRRDIIIILANSVTLVTLIILIFLYFNYGRRRR